MTPKKPVREPDLYITSRIKDIIDAYTSSGGAHKYSRQLIGIKIEYDMPSGNYAVYGLSGDLFMDLVGQMIKSLKRRGLAKELFAESITPDYYDD